MFIGFEVVDLCWLGVALYVRGTSEALMLM